jgi:hypothetical protein
LPFSPAFALKPSASKPESDPMEALQPAPFSVARPAPAASQYRKLGPGRHSEEAMGDKGVVLLAPRAQFLM